MAITYTSRNKSDHLHLLEVSRNIWEIKGQLWGQQTDRTRQTEQDRQSMTDRTRQTDQDRHNKTDITRQTELDRQKCET